MLKEIAAADLEHVDVDHLYFARGAIMCSKWEGNEMVTIAAYEAFLRLCQKEVPL
jgi:hypothetical protein